MRQSTNVRVLGGDGSGCATPSVSPVHSVAGVQSVVTGVSANDSVCLYTVMFIIWSVQLTGRLATYFNTERRRDPVAFPKIRPHAPNTIQTPARSGLTFIGRVQQSLWYIGARMKEPDIKHAFKTGMATAILAAPAFFDSTRPLFLHYRGEWALISVRGFALHLTWLQDLNTPVCSSLSLYRQQLER